MTPVRFAIALALAATTLTAAAAAETVADRTAPSTVAGAAPAAQTSTPLSLRPGKPIELAPEPEHAATAWKVAFVLALVGGAALYLRRRAAPLESRQPELTIVRRASVGLRSELLVVNVEGQRLLIGVTPHSIQSLAILDGDDPEARVAPMPSRNGSTLGERFSAMLDTAARGAAGSAPTLPAEPPRRDGVERAARPSYHNDDVAEQARGLAALRRAG
jgi:flagellar biogenesis protein FliO